ncbi:MAG: MFS transporter [Candidatus Sumerlaeia bacterium]|nr:MFS transporter [Candidatus Sumerlaeia bacterium]
MRSFVFLNVLVFTSNFTDNALRILVWLTLGALAAKVGDSPDGWRALVGACYSAPWLIFSLLAGQLADRYSKRNVVLATRFLDLVIWTTGTIGYIFTQEPALLLGMLFSLGIRMSLFGPPSMGLIAEILPARRITWGNSWVDGLTFLGAILGTSFGGLAYDLSSGALLYPLLILTVLSSSSILASFFMSPIAAAEPTRPLRLFPLRQMRRVFAEMRSTPGMLWAFAGIILWWAWAGLSLQVAMKFAGDTLLMEGFGTSRFFIYVGIGVGMGSILAGAWARPHLELGFVPLAAFLMGVFSLLVGLVPASELVSGVLIALNGFFAGWCVIPLKGYLQRSAKAESRGGLLGTLNFFQYGAIFLASGGGYYLLTKLLGLSAPEVFLLFGVALIVLSIVLFQQLRNVTLRAIIYFVLNTLYRIRIHGLQHIPERGGCLVVSNHVSFADGLLMAMAIERPITPIIFDEIYSKWYIRPIVDLVDPIPISDHMPPRELIETLRKASDAIRAGKVVIIFAEGQISRVGFQLEFRKGLERIMKDAEAPIVPVAIDGMRGAFLGVNPERHLVTIPSRLRSPITIQFGEQMPGNSSRSMIYQRILALRQEAWEFRRGHTRLIHHEALRFPWRWALDNCYDDPKRPEGIRRYAFSVGTVVFAEVFKQLWKEEKRVGICLPPSIAASLLNHAALLAGKVPVNLNYTASNDVIKAICTDAEINVIFTSTEFLEKVKLQLPGRVIMVDQVAQKITPAHRRKALKLWLTKSIRQLERRAGNPHWKLPVKERLDHDASIIYSSGSTGVPKGVRLTHWNIASNIAGTLEVFSLNRNERILAFLPFFHSIGTMIFIFLPQKSGLRISFLPNPLDMAGIAEAVRAKNCTCMVATPTFLQAFSRRIDPADFGSLKLIIAGAEKLRIPLAEAFERRFGVPICEGYGTTECSPVVAVNTPNYRARDTFQRTLQYGTVGHVYPGVVVEVRDMVTGEVLPPGKSGLLFAKGPNIMKGYLNQPEKTAEVLQNGWYCTGDMGEFTEDGFLRITDRLSRFSKIGGEMVPHLNIENKLAEAISEDEGRFVVTSVEDEKKGERLIVLYTAKPERARQAFDRLANDSEFPNLWKPKWADFFAVEAIPMLGTGKTDLRKVKDLAVEKVKAQPAG